MKRSDTRRTNAIAVTGGGLFSVALGLWAHWTIWTFVPSGFLDMPGGALLVGALAIVLGSLCGSYGWELTGPFRWICLILGLVGIIQGAIAGLAFVSLFVWL